jgi:hypothetical protein
MLLIASEKDVTFLVQTEDILGWPIPLDGTVFAWKICGRFLLRRDLCPDKLALD